MLCPLRLKDQTIFVGISLTQQYWTDLDTTNYFAVRSDNTPRRYLVNRHECVNVQ